MKKLFQKPVYNMIRCPWCKTYATRVTPGRVTQSSRYECQKESCEKKGVMFWDIDEGWIWRGKKYAPLC
jgi:hypothetical protein